MGLDDFTLETFTPHVGTTFHLSFGSHELDLSLESAAPIETESGGGAGGPTRAPFALTFIGPLDPVWHQGTYDVTHEHLGGFPLFVVPLGPEGEVMRYEAVFF